MVVVIWCTCQRWPIPWNGIFKAIKILKASEMHQIQYHKPHDIHVMNRNSIKSPFKEKIPRQCLTMLLQIERFWDSDPKFNANIIFMIVKQIQWLCLRRSADKFVCVGDQLTIMSSNCELQAEKNNNQKPPLIGLIPANGVSNASLATITYEPLFVSRHFVWLNLNFIRNAMLKCRPPSFHMSTSSMM